MTHHYREFFFVSRQILYRHGVPVKNMTVTMNWLEGDHSFGVQSRFVSYSICTVLLALASWNSARYMKWSGMYRALVGVYINTTKTTFLLKLWFLTSFFQITSLQVSKEKLIIYSFSLIPSLCVSLLFGRNQNWNRKSSLLYGCMWRRL